MSFVAIPTNISVNTTGNVINLVGTGSAWVPGTTTFSISGGTGASITSQTTNSATSATITVTSGSSAGTLTISNNTDVTTRTITVTNWQLMLDDNFNRSNTSTGAANNITSVGNNWIDVTGSRYNIQSNTLQINAITSIAFSTSKLLRPSSENLATVRYLVDCTPASSSNFDLFVLFNVVDSSNYHMLKVTGFYNGFVNCQLAIFRVVAGTASSLATSSVFVPVSGNSYELDVQATTIIGTSVAITATLYNLTALTSVTATFTDSVATALAASAQHGISADLTAGLTANISRIRIYYSNPSGVLANSETVPPNVNTTLTMTGTATSYSGATLFTLTNANTTASIASQSNIDATHQSVTVAGGTTSGAFVLADGSGGQEVIFISGAAISANLTSVTTGQSGVVITLTGVATVWSTSMPTFTLTGSQGASGMSITSQTIISNTSATITINTGTTGGVLTITDPVDMVSTSLNSFYPVPFSDLNVYYSPGNCVSDGSGILQTNNILTGTTVVKMPFVDAYVKFNWTGSDFIFFVNTASNAGGSFRYSIDGSSFISVSLPTSGGSSSQQYVLATGLSFGTHSVYISLVAFGSGATWVTQPAALTINGFSVNGGTATQTLLSGVALFDGDSYMAGVSGAITGNSSLTEGMQTIAWSLAGALHCEYGTLGTPGHGFTVAGGQVPEYTPSNDANSSWNKVSSSLYRTYTSGLPALGGKFSPVPNYYFALLGTNDTTGGAPLQASIVGWLTDARLAAGTSCKIILGIAPNGQSSSDFYSAMTTYQSTAHDANAFIIDLGYVFPGISRTPNSPTQQSVDNLHPRGIYASIIASGFMLALGMQLGTGGGGGTASNILLLDTGQMAHVLPNQKSGLIIG